MRRVLIPTDDQSYLPNWISGYRALGWGVITGAGNFFYPQPGICDCVHIQWPEELSGWKEPTRQTFATIQEQLSHWKENCVVIGSVNNLYPHGAQSSKAYAELYSLVYGGCDLIHHFSEASKSAFIARYDAVVNVKHLVGPRVSYHPILDLGAGREWRREDFNLREADFVVLVFGALRTEAEVDLVKKAFSLAKVGNKRLLITRRYFPAGGRLQKSFRLLKQSLWLRRNGAAKLAYDPPDVDLKNIFSLADVVLVPRIDDLSSGLPLLAMTLGSAVIAPSHGAFPEYLAGTENFLYESGDSRSLALAIERAANQDCERIGLANAALARSWRWEDTVKMCLRSAFTNDRSR